MKPLIPSVALRCRAEPGDIRAALEELRTSLNQLGLSAPQLATVELVAAEALNNIAEHAYAEGPSGDVTIQAVLSRERLCVTLRDHGRPLPEGHPPAQARPDTGVALNELPEGGFGWYLIRDLTHSFTYYRVDGENLLDLHFRLRGTAPNRQKP